MSTKPRSWKLIVKSSRSESKPQKPQYSSGFSKFRKTLSIKPRGKRSKTQWQVFAFSKRDSLGFPDWEKK